MIVGMANTVIFLRSKKLRRKFKLSNTDVEDWNELMDKISRNWRYLLDEEDNHHAILWVGFYINGKEDPEFVFQCTTEFTVSCVQWYNLTLRFPVPCYTVGTYSRCLRVWEHPLGEMDGFFYEVKVIRTYRGPKDKGEEEKYKEEIIFFYGKVATLGWDPDRWRWSNGSHFLNYSTKSGREAIVNRNLGVTRAVEKWQGYLPGNYRFY